VPLNESGATRAARDVMHAFCTAPANPSASLDTAPPVD
jgi:hypothetical protein